MVKTKLDRVIDDFNNLSLEEKEYITEILYKQLIETKRETITKRVEEALQNYHQGAVRTGTVEDLRRDLESD
ncbi:MAG: hypothetical protein FVQ80_19030 [Planctomycetes bacterium]|nr:hypothetical protein [Planctomycetota bacterium]